MEGLTGVRNFCKNIRPVMEKLNKGKKLHPDEAKTIVQFYLEVDYVTELLERQFDFTYTPKDGSKQAEKDVQELCEECDQPMANHDDGECPKKFRED